MLKFIEPIYFFISLFIGIFFIYISSPPPNIIIKYPTPENTNNLIYKDDADTCYKYIANEIQCPSDTSNIKIINPQYLENNKDNNKDNTGLFGIIRSKFNL